MLGGFSTATNCQWGGLYTYYRHYLLPSSQLPPRFFSSPPRGHHYLPPPQQIYFSVQVSSQVQFRRQVKLPVPFQIPVQVQVQVPNQLQVQVQLRQLVNREGIFSLLATTVTFYSRSLIDFTAFYLNQRLTVLPFLPSSFIDAPIHRSPCSTPSHIPSLVMFPVLIQVLPPSSVKSRERFFSIDYFLPSKPSPIFTPKLARIAVH